MRENQPKTNTPELFTDRLHLRKFTADDTEAVFRIYSDREVNTFLPWFPVKNMKEAQYFFQDRYSYREQWQPKNIPVIFRMYQINLDGRDDRVYRAYWERYPEHFISERI